VIWIIDDATKTVQSVPLGSKAMLKARNVFMTRVEAEATLAMESSRATK
jgi:hypothetical protein